MASIRLKRTKADGSKVYEIRASKSRGQGQKSSTWVAPAGWSQKAIDRELAKIAADLDRGVKSGEILTRTEQIEKDKAAAEEAAKIKTVRQYGDGIYIPGKQGSCAYRTIEYYKATLERYIYPAIGDMKMTEVKTVTLKNIILKAENDGYAHSTRRGIYLTLAQMFEQANIDDVIEVNPMAKVKAPRRNKNEAKNEREIFTDAQLEEIHECLKHEPLKWRAYFNVMMETGAREGELCALKWDNIDFKNKTILIDSTAVNVRQNEGSSRVIVTRTKNGKSRVNPLSTETLQMLHDMQLQSGQFDYVFVQTRMTVDRKAINEPLSPQSVGTYLRKFVKKYGIMFKCHPHKFRHTVASMLLRNGVSLQDTAKYIGDLPETVARFYLHALDDAVLDAGKVLHRAIGRA